MNDDPTPDQKKDESRSNTKKSTRQNVNTTITFEQHHHERPRRNWLYWVSVAIGAGLVLLLAEQHFQFISNPPKFNGGTGVTHNITVKAEAVTNTAKQTIVKSEQNLGPKTDDSGYLIDNSYSAGAVSYNCASDSVKVLGGLYEFAKKDGYVPATRIAGMADVDLPLVEVAINDLVAHNLAANSAPAGAPGLYRITEQGVVHWKHADCKPRFN